MTSTTNNVNALPEVIDLTPGDNAVIDLTGDNAVIDLTGDNVVDLTRDNVVDLTADSDDELDDDASTVVEVPEQAAPAWDFEPLNYPYLGNPDADSDDESTGDADEQGFILPLADPLPATAAGPLPPVLNNPPAEPLPAVAVEPAPAPVANTRKRKRQAEAAEVRRSTRIRQLLERAEGGSIRSGGVVIASSSTSRALP